MSDAIAKLSDDLLNGATEIADFLGWDERKVYHAAKRKYIPVTKVGATLVGSKRRLKRHFSGDDSDSPSGKPPPSMTDAATPASATRKSELDAALSGKNAQPPAPAKTDAATSGNPSPRKRSRRQVRS